MANETLSSLITQADTYGYATVEVEPSIGSLTEAAVAIGGAIKASSIGRLELNGERETDWMLRHTESITQPEEELLGYFALGCIKPAEYDGATVVYDGIQAATVVDDEQPQLSSITTRYTSTIYDGQLAVHPLVTDTPHGRALRYRSQARTNELLNLPGGLSETRYYSTVESILDSSRPYVHQWQPGQLLLVNNRRTIHSRQPYEGRREMVRYRFDDPHFATITLH